MIVAASALVLAWALAPRPPNVEGAPSSPETTTEAGLVATEPPPRIRPLVIGRRRPPAPVTREPAGPRVELGAPAPDDDATEIATGFVSGHVVDDHGYPVKHAVVHLHGPSGTLAHRTDEEGSFHIAVPAGNWTAEAGWYDGDEEWRSRPVVAKVVAGENVALPFEILMQEAAHGVHSAIKEAMGVGWEIAHDDGPLLAGDVLVEVDGMFLADLQPETVKAALRSRVGEQIAALVLRRRANGDYEEVSVVLDAR